MYFCLDNCSTAPCFKCQVCMWTRLAGARASSTQPIISGAAAEDITLKVVHALFSKVTKDYDKLNIHLRHLFYIYNSNVSSIIITCKTIQMPKYRGVCSAQYNMMGHGPVIYDFFRVVCWECGSQEGISQWFFHHNSNSMEIHFTPI